MLGQILHKNRTIPKYFGLDGKYGRKTGIYVPEDISKDENGFDDVAEFFDRAQRIQSVSASFVRPCEEFIPNNSKSDCEQISHSLAEIANKIQNNLPSGDQIAGLETEAALEAPPSPLSGSNRNVSDLFTSIEDSTPSDLASGVRIDKVEAESALEASSLPISGTKRNVSDLFTSLENLLDLTVGNVSFCEEDVEASLFSANVLPSDTEVLETPMKVTVTTNVLQPDTEVLETPMKAKDTLVLAQKKKRAYKYIEAPPGSPEPVEHELDETFYPCDSSSSDESTPSESLRGSALPPIALRRIKRNTIQPLKYWKCEYAKMEKRQSGGVIIKEAVRVPDTPPIYMGRRATKKLAPTVVEQLRKAGLEGEKILVKTPDGTSLEEVVRVSASFIFDKDSEKSQVLQAFNTCRFASGILVLPPETAKESQNSKTNTIIFHVLAGKLEVFLNGTVFTLHNGCHFYVPPGNDYVLLNKTRSRIKLMYCQIK
ncbi:uncharacterized protein LOC135145251 isoform X2 [Zophobas morio]|uniref:uncharacterized protein LOC135145251 isoform X2 n=1 Tax=Zophobas morio TaxID=2755281 RepID=UPI003083A5BB